jgi:hypothetical protein
MAGKLATVSAAGLGSATLQIIGKRRATTVDGDGSAPPGSGKPTIQAATAPAKTAAAAKTTPRLRFSPRDRRMSLTPQTTSEHRLRKGSLIMA